MRFLIETINLFFNEEALIELLKVIDKKLKYKTT